MKPTLIPILLLPLLAACSPPVWVKDGVTAEQEARDRQECEYEAGKAVAGIDSAWDRGAARYDLRAACLELRGYRKARAR